MSSTSAVWRDAQLTQVMVPPVGAEPVPEKRVTDPRELAVDHIVVTMYGTDGRWAIGSLALHGVWCRKGDRQPGTRKGNILLLPPLRVDEGAPQWLVERLARLVSALDLAYEVAER